MFKKVSFLTVKLCNINTGVKSDKIVELEREGKGAGRKEEKVRKEEGKEV